MEETTQKDSDTATATPIVSEETTQLDAPTPHLTINSSKSGRSKKPILMAVTILLIAAVIFATWYMTLGKKKPVAETAPQNNQSVTENKQTQNSKLFGVSYAYGDAEKDGLELFWRPVTGGDRRSAKNIGSKNYVAQTDVYENQVLVISTPSNGSSDGVIIWHSADSGQTYEKLHGFSLPEPDSVGEQITSAIFSKDGTKIVFGYLAAVGKSNIVKQIDIKTKEITDLITINTSGVFLQGYDNEKNVLFYYSGCYNCDGNRFNKLHARDLKTDVETVLYDLPEAVGQERVMSKDLTKMLVLDGVGGDFLGGGPPFTLKEFDVVSKSFKELVTFEKAETSIQIGYRADNNTPYFSENKSIYGLAEDGSRTQLYEAAKPIVSIYYVDDTTVIASSGTFEDYSLSNYNSSSKKAVEILKGDNSTTIFGVTLQK